MPNPPLPGLRLRRYAPVSALVAIVSLSAAAATTAASSPPAYRSLADPNRPLATAVVDPDNLGGPRPRRHTTLRRTGARFVRMFVNWSQVAPASAKKPAGFEARDPADKAYQWAALDGQVTKAVAKGFAPIVYVQTAPRWAQQCTAKSSACRPSPSELAQFLTAAARRYSGRSRAFLGFGTGRSGTSPTSTHTWCLSTRTVGRRPPTGTGRWSTPPSVRSTP